MKAKRLYRPSDYDLSVLFALVVWCSKKHVDLERNMEILKPRD